jgi:hypothetical protein
MQLLILQRKLSSGRHVSPNPALIQIDGRIWKVPFDTGVVINASMLKAMRYLNEVVKSGFIKVSP